MKCSLARRVFFRDDVADASPCYAIARRDAPCNKFHYPHGVGVNGTSLFVQSNFGIVTAAVINLVPKPERLVLVEADFYARDIRVCAVRC